MLVNKQDVFQKHICPPWCKIQIYLLCRSKTCPKQVNKGLKYIKWTTQRAKKSGLTLTFKHVTWKSIGIIYSLRATPAPSMVLITWKSQKILSGQHSGLRRVVWPWPLNMWPENQGSSTHWGQPLYQVWYWSSEGVKRYWADNTVGWEELFDLDLWTCDLKINRDHLLIEGNPCTKFSINQVKGSKDIEWTTLGVQNDRPTYRPTVAKTICPLFQGGHKNRYM